MRFGNGVLSVLVFVIIKSKKTILVTRASKVKIYSYYFAS